MTEHEKQNKTNIRLKKNVAEFNATRAEALPRIENLTASIGKQKKEIDEIKAFYDKFQIGDEAILKFINVLNSEPNYDKLRYLNRGNGKTVQHESTEIAMKKWNDTSLLGGSITMAKNTDKTKHILTPSIYHNIKFQNEDVLGFFELKNVLKQSHPIDIGQNTEAIFYDISLLLVAAPDWSEEKRKKAVDKLKELEAMQDPP